MLNILVTGSNGQVGQELQVLAKSYPHAFFFTYKNQLDISDPEALAYWVEKHVINAIINCAAYTAVDKAEREENVADAINHQALHHLVTIAKKKHIKLIHISTDYVFDGMHFKPYIETDHTNPQSVYGKTKLDGEMALLHVKLPNSIIIRTSWVYSHFGHNFVKTMLRLGSEKESLGVVCDQIGSPTYARDLAKVILEILPYIDNAQTEIYHYSNEGVCSWYDFAKEIMQVVKLTCKIIPIETKAYPMPAKRPHYSVLNKAKLKQAFDVEIPYWKDSLVECLKKMDESE
ncbi:MAG: dTDP-4-dehydrorhamnose reductase [Erysipelotrichia bacterium]|nr:dTDP-4-dehydrorhamnose reductase [Erysipelotrichia bacterium]